MPFMLSKPKRDPGPFYSSFVFSLFQARRLLPTSSFPFLHPYHTLYSFAMPPATVITAAMLQYQDQDKRYMLARRSAAAEAITPTEDQRITLIIIASYTFAILLLWNMPIAKIVLAPFKVGRPLYTTSSPFFVQYRALFWKKYTYGYYY